MKIVVIGGTGLIGSKVIQTLRDRGHEAVAASPDTGVNTVTGEGLDEALAGANVVIDVSNSPSFEDEAVLRFFETSTRNLLTAEEKAGVGHHVALSVVGSDELPNSGYLRAKVAQEKLIEGSRVPFSIVRSTQFFEFLKRIASEASDGSTVRLPPVMTQPIAAEDAALAVSMVAMSAPANGTVEVAGPEELRFDTFIQTGLSAYKDSRRVVPDARAPYFGTQLSERSLMPRNSARLGKTRLQDWLARQAP
jgi:uncharacterized protein YbjT (DUF2867 family)